MNDDSTNVSRRDFVLQSALLAGGMLAADAAVDPAHAATANDAPATAQDVASHLTLWYRRPAQQWVEALPVGNGRLGAMVFGGVERERLQLNEDTLWTGGPREWNNPNAPKALAEVRRLVAEGKYAEADRAAHGMQGPYTQSYAPLGNLVITFEHGDAWRGYRRQLDLQSAVADVRYRIGNTNYVREVIASHPDQVIAVRLSADRPGMISFNATLDSLLRHDVQQDGAVLKLVGRAPAHADPSYFDSGGPPIVYRDDAGMRFETQLSAAASGGRTWIDRAGLHVRGADEVVLRLTAATSFNGYDRNPVTQGRDAGAIAARQLSEASAKPWAALREAHV